MCPIPEVTIESVEHKNHSFGLSFNRVTISHQFYEFSFLVVDLKVNEVHVGEAVITERIWLTLRKDNGCCQECLFLFI